MSASYIPALPITKYFFKKVLKAMEHPYIWLDIDQMLKHEKLLSAQYVNGNVNKKNFEKGLEKIHAEVPSIVAKTLPELEAIMEIMELSDDIKNTTLAEMKIRYESAIDKGYVCRFSVWIYKTVQGGLYMYCATQIKV